MFLEMMNVLFITVSYFVVCLLKFIVFNFHIKSQRI